MGTVSLGYNLCQSLLLCQLDGGGISEKTTHTIIVDRYAQAIAAPDRAKLQRYVVDIGFRKRTDAVIAAAEALPRGEALVPTAARQAVEQDAKSLYAQALSAACR